MTQQAPLPSQAEPAEAPGDGLPPAVPPTPPGASEATRLLCAGSYLDETYRDAVIDELYVHEERLAAPSLGFDAARVLAHALRARRLELGWAALILFLWILGVALSAYLLLVFLVPSLLLFLAAKIRGPAERPPVWRRVPAWVLKWYGRLLLLFSLYALGAVVLGEGGGLSVSSFLATVLPDPLGGFFAEVSAYDTGEGVLPFHAWAALGTLLLVTACVGAQRGQFARALAGELHPKKFGDMARDPAERAEGVRFHRLRDRIRTEQHAPLVMYHPAHPFCGAGEPFDPWTLAVELRPDPDREQRPLSNRVILEAVRPLLAELRVPAPHAEGGVRDRLRQLQIDECVFLPVTGLPRRELAPYDERAFEVHRAEAVEEGGETRRHFLRIRVGGWEEEVVTTVFVRVHTQGGMLMLEIAPHVLLPVREDFENADRIAHQYRHNSLFGKAVWALARTPRSLVTALTTLGRGLVFSWSVLTGGHGGALPDGPARSVRELGAGSTCSLFQDMDVRRYLKSVQDRVANGVRTALRDAGYRTDEFAQKIVNVSGGGTLIENATGAFAVGDHNVITHQAAPPGSPGARPANGTSFTKDTRDTKDTKAGGGSDGSD